MKKSMKLFTALIAVGAFCATSFAQTDVATEDFESYSVGAWNAASAPVADPTYYGGGSGEIVSVGGTNQEVVVDINLVGQYDAGMIFNLDMSGNVSHDIHDYEMEVYFRVDPTTWSSLTNMGLVLTLYNPDNPNEGTEMQVFTQPGYGNAVTNGALLSFTFNPDDVYVKWDKKDHLTASIPTWQVSLGFGLGGSQGQVDQPVLYAFDDIVVKYNAPPLVNPEGSPAGDQLTNDVTVVGTVYDGANEVDLLELYLDGAMVATTSNHTGGSITNVITYDAMDLALGQHEASVTGTDTTGTNTVSHTWTFNIVGQSTPPATEILALYNCNIGGTVGYDGNPEETGGDGPWLVPDGTVIGAPSVGSNAWHDICYTNAWWFGGDYDGSVAESSQGSSTITDGIDYFTAHGGFSVYPLYWWDYSTWPASVPDTIWGGSLTGADFEVKLQNLPEGVNFDLYLYYTNPQDTGITPVTYSMIKGSPSAASVLAWDSEHTAIFDGAVVQTTNYVVYTDVVPDSGEIVVHVNGGLSALQLAARAPTASVIPNIQSFVLDAGNVELVFDSQQFINYSVKGKADLQAPIWSAVTNGIPGSTNATTTVMVPMGVGNEFYIIQSD